MGARYNERFARVESILLIENKIIDKDELKASCSYGVPDRLRPLLWRLLLEYLPTERAAWTSFLAAQRETYNGLVRQLIVDVAAQQTTAGDPLSDCCSHWGGFFADNTTLAQIDKDVRRLCPEIQFFQQTTKWPHSEAVSVNLSGRVTQAELRTENYGVDKVVGNTKKRASEEYANAKEQGSETHWQVAERILFIYAKLNPGVKYVQGMNEVLGPIYYVLASDPDEEWAEHAEADTFFCFQQLMSEIKDNFIKTLDDSQCGIEYSMSSFHSLLSAWDPVLHAHLVGRLQIKPQFYAFRWLSLMLSQEFPLPDVIGLWDALFADTKKFTLLPYVCLSMLQRVREQLLRGDFADCLRLLQNYPETDAQILVMDAYAIREGRAVRPSTRDDDAISNGSGAKKNFAGMFTDKLRSTINLIRK